jgi:hypothetical protein
MDEFPTANDAKELMCYVTPDLHQDMDTIKHRYTHDTGWGMSE